MVDQLPLPAAAKEEEPAGEIWATSSAAATVGILPMSHISIRDLQKLSGKAITSLPGATAVKSGDRSVGLLIPLKAADPDRLAAVLARAEALARGCDQAVDDAALAAMGIDPTEWSVEAVRALMAERSKDE